MLPLIILGGLAIIASAQVPFGLDPSSSRSCQSLRNSCNAATVDFNNFYNSTACVLLTVCESSVFRPDETLNSVGAPKSQPRMTESAFLAMTDGAPAMTQQNYIDAYYNEISVTPNGTYPQDTSAVIAQFNYVAAWTGFCGGAIPFSNFADWIQYSSTPGVCPSVMSCDPKAAAAATPCVPQPITDNGSCQQMVNQCQLWVTQGLFQNQYCVLASFCYAQSTTDVLLRKEYPYYISKIPTSLSEGRLSLDVFKAMTNGSATMSQQNAIDAYYTGLTGTWISLGGPFAAETPSKTNNNGPYPTSPDYIVNFWGIISAWTGSCATKEIPYQNLADYLQFAASSGYHPTC
ncbi:uncharacterized protein LACBIDRAFT_294094 [Laccaria bicolor S238N-H82]|uniref:Predicted protein n=1 Tax=Laccaria bicolor (strain S238N-H82 / ATCC MYA-4686) TaxID=486041 RepID=B0D938_LACBS|nr:uncharacterized protein LACBIDRAFT_294094 [Laccaria bicolor S238N-H82]EDR08942.1 predicted protein [Laccaria bicolor S238N-H82]|eukprot:XP_001880255.1 predicted protein [Laccaria bicolor S238N-H82]